jgi:hypothetical protein
VSIIHLVRDFEEVVFNYGKEKGLIFSENNRTQAVIRILNFYRKIGIGNKKVISYARNIKIPKKYQKRVESVLNYLSRGGDITPYLLTQSINLDCQQDLMFNDWNILHIHLGKKLHTHKPRFIERTGELLFLLNTDCEIRVLGLYHHNPPSWSRKELIQKVYDNWPEMINPYQEMQLVEKYNDQQRGQFRKAHMTVIDEVYDKKRNKTFAVMMKNMGIASSGDAVIDVITYDDICNFLHDMEFNIQSENPLSTAKLYECNGRWFIVDYNLHKIYWTGKLINFNCQNGK